MSSGPKGAVQMPYQSTSDPMGADPDAGEVRCEE